MGGGVGIEKEREREMGGKVGEREREMEGQHLMRGL